jgi:subtilase family serine protease
MKTFPSVVTWVTRSLTAGSLVAAICTMMALLSANPACLAEGQALHGHLPRIVKESTLQTVGRLPASDRFDVVIGLPLRNRKALADQLHQIYDPASPGFRHYLTPEQFTEMFGPTVQDYQTLVSFAQSNGLEVIIAHPNRTLLHVRAPVAEIERVFHVALRLYDHPTESRTFYAPDVEPSLDLDLPILHISGLDNFAIPRSTLKTTPVGKGPEPRPNGGSGPAGSFSGNDFRAAYVPGVPLTGSGQVVGLLQFDGYYKNDIIAYENSVGLPDVPLQNVFLDGFTGTPSGNNVEVSLDIEMVIAMAPGVSKVVIYGASSDVYCVDILNEMANPTHGEPLPNQLSTSWAIVYNDSVYQAFQQMASQGQSFFAFSGDKGAYTAYTGGPGDTLPFPPGDYTYVTSVGGTTLNTSGPGGSWVSETTWHESGGGPSPWFAIPSWQMGIDMSSNHGSTTARNCPDVAMVADNILVRCNNGSWVRTGGTSASTPLWAGFTALVNQQATASGRPPVGFINPAIYEIGQGASYASCFHDITTGNNAHGGSSANYFAVPGYDLCTGWGTPNGVNLIYALSGLGQLVGAVWVDFNYNGSIQNGNYDTPFRTLAGGTNVVASGGTIAIKTSGSSPETMKIARAMTIRAVGGSATVGR